MRWKKHEPIAEIEIASLGTTPPTSALVADGDFVVFETVELIEMFQAFMDEAASRFFVSEVVLLVFTPAAWPPASPYHDSKFQNLKHTEVS